MTVSVVLAWCIVGTEDSPSQSPSTAKKGMSTVESICYIQQHLTILVYILSFLNKECRF